MTTYIKNKKAFFDFEILKTFEAGVVLAGHEVKAIRNGKAALLGAYVIVRGSEVFLVNSSISPYQAPNTPKDYDPERPRKLLLHQKEIKELERAVEQSRLTIVPIKWYNKNRRLKLEIGLARGKKKADKRESIKLKDTKRDLERHLKSY